MVDGIVLPMDWEVDILGHCVRIETGSRNTEDKKDNGRYPFFVRSQQVEHIDTYNYDCEAVLTAGDGVGTGKVFHYYNGKFDVHQRVYILSEFDKVIGRFLYYYFKMNFLKEVEKYTAKSSVDSVRRDMIAKMQIPIPATKEQISITEALSDIDNLTSSLQKLIDKKKTIKQGVMQELLTGKKRLTGFKKEWIHKALGEVAIIKDGTHGTFERKKDGVFLLSAKNVFNGHLILDNESFISREDYLKIIENGYPAKGDILLSCVGTIGRCCIYTGKPKAAFQRSVAFIRTSKMCNTFLLYLLQEEVVQNKLRQSANASAQGGVYLGTLIDIDLYYPSDVKEQQAIAQVFTEMDNEIEQLEKKLDKYQQIKQGMMQELLTGHIRLIDNGEET